MDDAKAWLNIIHGRITRYASTLENLSLATAYNQLGICYINKDEVDDAMESWKHSVTTYASVEGAPDFSGTWPRISLAQWYTLRDCPTDAEDMLTPTLKEHERILGEDDVTTSE